MTQGHSYPPKETVWKYDHPFTEPVWINHYPAILRGDLLQCKRSTETEKKKEKQHSYYKKGILFWNFKALEFN